VTNRLLFYIGNPEGSTTRKASSGRGRILALDYGRRRIGMALSDELCMTARPLGILERTNRRNDLRRFREIARQHSAELILVGHPLSLEGATGEMAAEAERFARRLARALGIPVQLADERLTSWEAGEILRAAGQQHTERADDDIAAAVMLRDFLSRSAPAPEPAPPEPQLGHESEPPVSMRYKSSG
jgi:putative Holliday junction resolvase